MDQFDPKAYLAEKTQPQQQAAFDPKAYLAQQGAPPEEPSLQGGNVRSVADLVSPGFNRGAVEGATKEASLGNVNIDTPSSSPAGQGAGHALGMAGIAAAGGGPVAAMESGAGKIAASGAMGGLQGLLQKPGGEDTLQNRAQGAGIGALLGSGMQTAGNIAGWGGDKLMQMATNVKKFVPGMGTEMANQGLWGTKGMMKKQIASALPQREQELQSAVSRMSGKIDPEETANAIRSTADGYTPNPGPSGPMPMPAQNQPFFDAAKSRADDALSRGAMAPSEALDVSRKIAKPAYGTNGEPLDNFKNQISQTEGGSLKDAIKNTADEQGIPEVRNSLKSEAALLTANRGLNQSEHPSSALIKALLKGGLGAGVGYETNGIPGALAGAAASTSLGQSTAGRAGVAASQAAPYASQALIDALNNARRK